mmetsp:Transcript_5978/g.10862  ORF Transcript_5978/g.10862 Transcript_5978/m.10862 type:complete len:281 (-) Transcript_5978:277-1119(-)
MLLRDLALLLRQGHCGGGNLTTYNLLNLVLRSFSGLDVLHLGLELLRRALEALRGRGEELRQVHAASLMIMGITAQHDRLQLRTHVGHLVCHHVAHLHFDLGLVELVAGCQVESCEALDGVSRLHHALLRAREHVHDHHVLAADVGHTLFLGGHAVLQELRGGGVLRSEGAHLRGDVLGNLGNCVVASRHNLLAHVSELPLQARVLFHGAACRSLSIDVDLLDESALGLVDGDQDLVLLTLLGEKLLLARVQLAKESLGGVLHGVQKVLLGGVARARQCL